eukprot:6492013-Amphidinium_carterae.2
MPVTAIFQSLHGSRRALVMRPNRELEQSVAIPDFPAARRPRLSPRAAQGIAPYAVAQQQTSAQSPD